MRRAALASSLTSLAGSIVALGALAGCPDRSISEVDPQQGRVEAKDIPVNINRNIDLLFLVDNSPSMGDKQKNLADNFPRFIDVLGGIPGGLPNVHIGVATSDLGSRGAGDAAPGPGIGRIGAGGCSGNGLAGALQLNGVQTDNGTNAELFLSDIQPDDLTMPRIRNYSGDLATVFGQMAKVGAGGCGFEQHLEGVKQALTSTNTPNNGFLRPDAFLAVIIIADEDDCSIEHSTLLATDKTSNATLGDLESFRCTRFGVTCDQGGSTTDAMNQVGPKGQCHPNDNSAYLTKVADYATFLKGLKSDPNKVIVAGIVGNIDPFATELRAPQQGAPKIPALAHSCTYNGADGVEVADPAVRIKFFLDQFPNRNTFASICQQDLSGGLEQIAELLLAVVGDPCIEGKLADVDPNTPGPQYDCAVTAATDPTIKPQTTAVIPQCGPDNGAGQTTACWHLVTDPVKCTNSDHLLLKVENEMTDLILKQDNSHVFANCVTQVTN